MEALNSELETSNDERARLSRELKEREREWNEDRGGMGGGGGELSLAEREELIRLRGEVAEFEVEFRGLKNQDITIRKLEGEVVVFRFSLFALALLVVVVVCPGLILRPPRIRHTTRPPCNLALNTSTFILTTLFVFLFPISPPPPPPPVLLDTSVRDVYSLENETPRDNSKCNSKPRSKSWS
jgi:hypothetical protein